MGAKSRNLINQSLRNLPAVDSLLENSEIKKLVEKWSQPLIVFFIRNALSDIRKEIREGKSISNDEAVGRIISSVGRFTSGFLRDVINAAGIIIHTNLGRSPLTPEITARISQISSVYSNLEFDLISGKRGKRGSALRSLISAATGCQSALVVNNNAAALFLILAGLARDKEVLVSRGELVQIGGGFKIPEIMMESGAILKEVGTTNRTSLEDYKKAISSRTGLILKVHRSNFMIEGFTEEARFGELAALGKRNRIPVAIDLGSGVLLPSDISGLPNEPTVRDAVKSKADLVCFSGDKLLGGCQAGIILGRKSLINRLNRNPIYRVLRPDKITIGITEELFIKYLKGDYKSIPIWNSVRVSKSELTKRSEEFIDKVSVPEGMLTIRDSYAYAGGGSDPGGKMESVIIKFNGFNSHELAAAFRLCDPPVIGRIEGSAFCIDLRTVLPHQEDCLVQLVRKTISELNKLM